MKSIINTILLLFLCALLTGCVALIKPEKTFDKGVPGDYLYGNRDGEMIKLNDSFVVFNSYGNDDDYINKVNGDDLWNVQYYKGPSQKVYYNEDFIIVQASEVVYVIDCSSKKNNAITTYENLDDTNIDFSLYGVIDTY